MSENALGKADSGSNSTHKYPALYDGCWLEKKYVSEGLSGTEIAEKIGCSNVSVYNALERHGIDRRDTTVSYDFPELHNREWLLEKYVGEHMDAKDIAGKLGCSLHTVYHRLEDEDIPTRTGGGGNKLETPLPSYGYNLIEGELLGDGGIFRRNENGDTACYQHGTSREKYREWLAEELEGLGFHVRTNTYESDNFTAHKLSTRNYYCLNEIRNRWYPNGTKIVPDGFRLTPVSLRQWFIGDGGVSTRDSWKRVRLHTEGFDSKSVENLQQALRWIGIGSTRREEGHLYIPSRYIDRFYGHMAELPSPLEDTYGYKWN